jgi:hypothetical protein
MQSTIKMGMENDGTITKAGANGGRKGSRVSVEYEREVEHFGFWCTHKHDEKLMKFKHSNSQIVPAPFPGIF